MIGLFASGATDSKVAQNGTKKLSQPFEELQGSNSEFMLNIPKPITWTISETNKKRFGMEGWSRDRPPSDRPPGRRNAKETERRGDRPPSDRPPGDRTPSEAERQVGPNAN